MKKIFCPLTTSLSRATVTAVLILISTITFAQVKPAFGVRAGLVSSSIRGEAASNLSDLLEFANGMITTNSRTGFYAGAYASIPLTEGMSVEPGLFYSEKGYELNGDLTIKGAGFLGANAKAKLQSQYLDIPIVLKADLGSGIQIFAGPQFSYLMKADLNTTAGLLGINLLNNKMDVTEQFNRWDAAVTMGAGYKLSNGINITASYDYGLSKIDKNQNTKAYNNAIKIGIGIQL